MSTLRAARSRYIWVRSVSSEVEGVLRHLVGVRLRLRSRPRLRLRRRLRLRLRARARAGIR